MIETQETAAEDPRAGLIAHYQQVWQHGSVDMAEINPALAIEVVDFVRYRGDWLGVMIAPWFIRLFLLPGGGDLWGDIPDGQRRYVDLAGGTQVFFAETAPDIGPFQYAPVLASVILLRDMAAARRIAVDALRTALGLPPPEPLAGGRPEVSEDPPAPLSRRGFLRNLIGRR